MALSLFETKIYKRLIELENDDKEISNSINILTKDIRLLLQKIPENMPEYTLHDENHSLNVINNMGEIIPNETFEKLNVIELSILIYSAYLHDIGMLCSRSERTKIEKSEDYLIFKNTYFDDILQEIDIAKEKGDSSKQRELEDEIFSNFIRQNHAKRALNIIDERFTDKIAFQGISYIDEIKQICESHALNIDILRDYEKDTLISNFTVNMQYLAIILRLSDLLDFYPSRTPKVLYDFIQPKNLTSINEWEKHLSIKGWNISDKAIKLSAICKTPNMERTLRTFLDYIEKEIRDAECILNEEPILNYKLNIITPIKRDKIKSDGSYIYSDLKFNLNYKQVINLFMGERLYPDPLVALRELLQNAVDAVRFREKLEKDFKIDYSPEIKIEFNGKELIIEDNGIGMDISIFERYFMNVGKSYYKSNESKNKVKNFNSISEFGIGVLSLFMIADRFTVESKLRPANINNTSEPIFIEIPTAYDYFVKKKPTRENYGTKVTLKLKQPIIFEKLALKEFLADIAPLVKYPIIIKNKTDVCIKQPLNNLEELLDFSFCEKILEIKINKNKSPLLKGLESKLFLYKKIESYANCQNLFSKHGFKVSRFSPKIAPWANICFVIDINDNNLSINTSRDSIIEDQNSITLSNTINAQIEEQIYNFLNQKKQLMQEDDYVKFLYNLVDADILFGSYKSSGIIPKRFLELIPLPIIINNKIKYKYANEIFAFNLIATHTYIIEKDKNKYKVPYEELCEILKKHFKGTTPFISMVGKEGRVAKTLINNIGVETKHYILTSENGLLLKIFNPNHISQSHNYSRKSFSDKIIKNSTKEPLFVFSNLPLLSVGYTDFIYNKNHPIFKPYLELDLSAIPFAEDQIKKIINNFDSAIHEYESFFRPYLYIRSENEYNRKIKNVMTSFKKCYSMLWNKYSELNVIKALKQPKFTEKDLPFNIPTYNMHINSLRSKRKKGKSK